MPLRLRVCRVDEVAPGELATFEVEGLAVPVMVAHVDGQLFASSSICPHEDVSLADGDLEGTLVTCPGHGYRFDLSTGRCSHDPQLVLRRYRTSIVDGDLYIHLL